MKSRSELIGIFLLICAFILMFNLGKSQTGSESNVSDNQPPSIQDKNVQIADNTNQLSDLKNQPIFTEPEGIVVLKNDVLSVEISDIGGAIRSAELNKYQATQGKSDPVRFKKCNDVNLLTIFSKNSNFLQNLQNEKFDITLLDESNVTLSKTLHNGCSIIRKYSIAQSDGKKSGEYTILHDMRIINNNTTAVPIGTISLFLGAMPASPNDSAGEYLSFVAFNGKKDFFIKLRDFKESNGLFGLGKRQAKQSIVGREKVMWGAIKNQFFTTILTPETPADGYISYPEKLNGEINENLDDAIAGGLIFDVGTLAPAEQYSLNTKLYLGPKDFTRLANLGNEQDRVMQFGFFGSISELLLRLMLKIYSVVPNWGWSIIILTTIVKLLLWPLTNAQVKSSKKMAAIQQPLKLLKEKFKNNPQKLQAETLKLFKENRINPAAGCLPIFIQIPIFFGLYYMLRTSSDLRFAHFLWINDLSLPDTVAHIGHFPINILPLIMGITMFFQMRITPMPTTDNSQKMIFKLMPAIFLLCCYNFPSGLVLYWTVQNLLTILQQLSTSRKYPAQESVVAQSMTVGKTRNKSGRKSVQKQRKN